MEVEGREADTFVCRRVRRSSQRSSRAGCRMRSSYERRRNSSDPLGKSTTRRHHLARDEIDFVSASSTCSRYVNLARRWWTASEIPQGGRAGRKK